MCALTPSNARRSGAVFCVANTTADRQTFALWNFEPSTGAQGRERRAALARAPRRRGRFILSA